MILEALRNMLPHILEIGLQGHALVFLVVPERSEGILHRLAPEIAFRPHEARRLKFGAAGHTRPVGCAVAARAVVAAAEKILMHIKVKIYSVFCAQVGNRLHFVEIFFVVFAGLRLNGVPDYAQAHDIEAVIGKARNGALVKIEGIYALLAALRVIALVAEIYAVEQPLPAVFVGEFSAFGSDFFHNNSPFRE